MPRYFILIYAILMLVSCTFIYEHFGEPLNYVPTEFQEGKTHYRDALAKMGPPRAVSASTNGLLFLYEYIDCSEKQLGINLGIPSVPWLEWFKFSIGRGNADRQALLMVFDEQGILLTQCFEDWNDDLGGGVAMEMFFSVQQLVDTSAYEDPIGPNQWGMSLLKPLPQTLNAHQSLETGQNGLELMATPTKAGQHTLEMR